MLYIAYNSLKSAISIRTLRKTLSEGKPINHNSPWKKHPNLSFVIHIIFTLGLVISAFLQFATSKTIPIQQAPKNLPIIRLKEGSFTKIDNKDFDQLIIFQREDDFKEAFALKGKGVIHVRYYGCADNDSIIKNIAQKIDLISN